MKAPPAGGTGFVNRNIVRFIAEKIRKPFSTACSLPRRALRCCKHRRSGSRQRPSKRVFFEMP